MKKYLSYVIIFLISFICISNIKAENIMLDSNCKIKLGDFGLSRITEDKNSLVNSFFGTETFLAPEVVAIPKKAYEPFKADIFSLGVSCLLY